MNISDSEYNNLFQMELKLTSSRQKEIVSNCESIGQIYSIFLQSYEILDKHLCLHSELKMNQDFLTENTLHKYEMDIYMKDLNYYLYTFLSAVKSLIDQTRIHCEKYHKQNKLFEEYNNKVKEQFANNPYTKFIEGLRNFIVHYQLVTIVSESSITDNQKYISLNLFLDKEALLKSGWNWGGKGKEYLERLNPKEPLHVLIATYYNKAVEFHKWYKKRQYEIYQAEYDYVNLSNAEIQSIGIKLAYESFEKQKSYSQTNFESVFFRYLYSKDVHQIMNINDSPSRGILLYNKLKEIESLPPLLIFMIVATYKIDVKNFRP